LTGDVTFSGKIVAGGNETKSIFAAVTIGTINIGGGGKVDVPGALQAGDIGFSVPPQRQSMELI